LGKQKNPLSKPAIAIAGGGVIGLSVAVLLQTQGYTTTLYAEEPITDLLAMPVGTRPQAVASVHAAASIIPRSVDHPDTLELTANTQRFLDGMIEKPAFAVRKSTHWEVFEERPAEKPDYLRKWPKVTPLPEDGSGQIKQENAPRRPGAKGVFGWRYPIYFCEVPVYLKALWHWYRQMGGTFVQKSFSHPSQLANLPGEMVVNCLGIGASKLFPQDATNTYLSRGHLVKLNLPQNVRSDAKGWESYNYTPTREIYWRGCDRDAADVYFYPRSDGWLMGGSREMGTLQHNGTWQGTNFDQLGGEVLQKHGWAMSIPKPIWTLNRDVLHEWKGIDIDALEAVPYAGYRFVRTPLRMEWDTSFKAEYGKPIFHNYGHGGAGYTLSWGSAFRVLENIQTV